MKILETVSCLDGYDPNALRVDKAIEAIKACLPALSETESVPVRSALGRVLAEDVVPQINVPAHDNSAMDGYAVRAADQERFQVVEHAPSHKRENRMRLLARAGDREVVAAKAFLQA